MLKFREARAAIPAQDISRARAFYEQTLGFSPTEEEPDGSVFYQVGASRFLVFPSSGKASGDHTQMGLDVEDVEATVSELKSKGVRIEEYDSPNLKTVGGIVDVGPGKAAWFKDTEGNLIGVLQTTAVGASPR